MDENGKLHFFKPDRRKIVLFFILFFVMFYFYLWFFGVLNSRQLDMRSQCCDDFLKGNRDACDFEAKLQTYTFPSDQFVSEVCMEYEREVQQGFRFTVTIFVLMFTASYVISCLIVWAFDRFRKK
jgi:hypothetical protein